MDAIAVWGIATVSSLIALVWAYRFYTEMMQADEGNATMQEIAASVRMGAAAYLNQQNKVVAVVFLVRPLACWPWRRSD